MMCPRRRRSCNTPTIPEIGSCSAAIATAPLPPTATTTTTGSPPCILSYDDNGNLTSDCTYHYRYDEENRLMTVIRISDSVMVGEYQYDALSRRVQKIANPSGTPTTTRYFYDVARIIEEQDPSG